MAVENGNKVRVSYVGKLTDGTEFDSGELEMVLGEQKLLPVLEEALLSMEEGDESEVSVNAADGYGEYRDSLVSELNKGDFPNAGKDLEVGSMLELGEGAEKQTVIVTELGETRVTVDANHPLASKDLVYVLKLLSVKA